MDLRTQVLRSIANYLVTSLPSKNIFKNMSVRNNIIEFSKESIDAIPKQVKTNPLDADAWYFRGNVQANMGRSEEAVESYDKAVAINPDHADAWYFRGNTLAHMNKDQVAVESYDKATRAREKSKQKSSRDN